MNDVIPDQTISIKISNYNRKKYLKLGYLVAETSEYINVNIKDLSIHSNYQIKIICDYCGCEYSNSYNAITKCRNNSLIHKDSCKKCRMLKCKETLKVKYGVENAGQIENGQIKRKQTNLLKYGVESPVQSEGIKEKMKQTCLERYGVDNAMKSKDIREKLKNVMIKKYGVPCSLCSDACQEKGVTTCLKKYGVKNPQQLKSVREKVKNTNLIKFGTEYASQSKVIKEKVINTVKERYGVENPFQSQEIKEKIRNTMMEKYGVLHPLCYEEFKRKSANTCFKHYGVYSPLKCKEIRNKIANTYYLSGNVHTSSQQKYIFNMIKDLGYNAVLNYPELSFNLDVAVFIDNYKIDIEYDGWYWHQNISKDIARNNVLIKHGWNIIRVLSGELIPKKEQIQEAIYNVLSKNKQIQLIQLNDWKNNEMKDEVI